MDKTDFHETETCGAWQSIAARYGNVHYQIIHYKLRMVRDLKSEVVLFGSGETVGSS